MKEDMHDVRDLFLFQFFFVKCSPIIYKILRLFQILRAHFMSLKVLGQQGLFCIKVYGKY